MLKASATLPRYKFHPRPQHNLPFEIGRLEKMPPLARTNQPHRHDDFYELIWICQGAGWHFIDFEPLPLEANSLFLLAPGQVHFFDCPTEVSGFSVLFTTDFLALLPDVKPILSLFGLFEPSAQRASLVPTEPDLDYLSRLFERLEAEYLAVNQPARTQMLRAYTQILLITLGRLITAPVNTPDSAGSGSNLYYQFVKLVNENFISLRKVSEYAKLLAITPGHLNEISRQNSGKSAGELIRDRVLLEAKRHLFYDEATIIQLAEMLNFPDPAYFNRFFKRYTTQSPLEFRKTILEKYNVSH